MANKSIHVFDVGGELRVFPAERMVLGRGTDHIVLYNSAPYTVVWKVPRGVFEEDSDHSEEVAKDDKSETHKVKTRRAKVITYTVKAARRRKRSLRRRRIDSDPIIIIDVS